jgi:hypothetical protein
MKKKVKKILIEEEQYKYALDKKKEILEFYENFIVATYDFLAEIKKVKTAGEFNKLHQKMFDETNENLFYVWSWNWSDRFGWDNLIGKPVIDADEK